MKLRLASTALDGQTVTLTLIQDGVTVGPLTVPSWGETATEGVSVTVEVKRSPAMTAPEGVFFTASGWTGFDTQKGDVDGYDGRQMDLIHIWSFGDPGASYQVPEKLLPEWRDRNTARGHFVAHVYENPGDHDWALTVIEPSTGRVATASGRITVADPDVTFAGSATAYVSQTGDFSDCPASVLPSRRFTSINAAKGAIQASLPGGRVMLARGQDFSVGTDANPQRDSLSTEPWQLGAIHFVAGPGSGTRPRLVVLEKYGTNTRIGTLGQSYLGGEFVVSNVVHVGLWDSRTETGEQMSAYSPRGQGLKLFNRCRFEALNPWTCTRNNFNPVTGAYPTGQPEAAPDGEWERINHSLSNLISNECIGEGGDNYALFGNGIRRYAILGTQLTHYSDGRSGGDFRPGAAPSNHSGAIRIEGDWPTDMFIDGSDFFARSGWFRNLDEFRTIQPCLRYNTNARPGFFLNVQRSSFEGGGVMLANMRQNNNEVGIASPSLIEHCIFVTSHMTSTCIDVMGAGFAVRSNLFVNPNRPSITWDFAFRWAVRANYVVGERSNSSAEFPEIYLSKAEVTGNTLIDLCTTPNTMGRMAVLFDRAEDKNPNPFGEVVVENNIVHEPNRDVPFVPFRPLDQTPIWAPREIYGPISSYSTAKGTYPSRFHRGDTITLPWPAGTDASMFEAAGATNPKSRSLDRPREVTIEHTAAGFVMTNNGDSASDDKNAGAAYTVELDRTSNPATYPQFASPADSVWRGTPMAGSAAIGAATTDDVPYEDLRGRERPVHASIGALEV